MQYAYLQHGHGTAGPFMTEEVQLRVKSAKSRDRDGCSPTEYQVEWLGAWRRVYHCPETRCYVIFMAEWDGTPTKIVVKINE